MSSGLPVSNLGTLAKHIAVECRYVIQGCLREEEWRDADQEFTTIILSGLKKLVQRSMRKPVRRRI